MMKETITKIISYLLPKKPSRPLTPGSDKTLLVIDDYVPHHDKSSGSKRLYELLKLFSALRYNIIFLPDDGRLTEPYTKDLTDLGIKVLSAQNNKLLLKEFDKIKNSVQYAWISRPALNIKYQKLLNTNTKRIFDTVDLHYLRLQRQAENDNNKKLQKRALKTKSIELTLAKNSDATITVTESEKMTLNDEGVNRVFVVPNVHLSTKAESQPGFSDRKGLLFIGGFKHDPNIDAARWLINQIMPKVWERDKSIHLTLLGSDPTEELLSFNSPGIAVPGYIHDVAPFFHKNRLFVAPLRYGAGMKGKIGQSLEFGLPVITTDIGAEGMDLQNEKNVILANSTDEFVDKILLLYNSENLWSNIRNHSLQAIDQYSPDKVTQKIQHLFNTINE